MNKLSAKNKPDHDPAACSSALANMGDALYVIGGKWKLRLILALQGEKRRFNELQRTIPGISARVLSNELKDLEQNGFVKRHVSMDYPVLVEYELTDYCETLSEVLQALSNWGARHRIKIREDVR